MKNIILGVTGGIAAYKSANIASIFTKKGFSVKTVLTENAARFITDLTFRTITAERVYSGLWDSADDENHTNLSEWAELIVIAPCTANTIAKISCGIADNLLTALVLDFTGPVFIFPAMHENMWFNPATKENVLKLRERGFHVYDPAAGDLAGGKKGVGRMIEPDCIFEEIISVLDKKSR